SPGFAWPCDPGATRARPRQMRLERDRTGLGRASTGAVARRVCFDALASSRVGQRAPESCDGGVLRRRWVDGVGGVGGCGGTAGGVAAVLRADEGGRRG